MNHVLPAQKQFICERASCREKICDNCAYKDTIMNFEQKLCALCYLATVNNMERKSRQLNDDDFCFDISPTSAMDSDLVSNSS